MLHTSGGKKSEINCKKYLTISSSELKSLLFPATEHDCPHHQDLLAGGGRRVQVLCGGQERERDLAALRHPHPQHVPAGMERGHRQG